MHGAVAHLARAIEWHSIGSRFDPDQLQKKADPFGSAFFACSTKPCINVIVIRKPWQGEFCYHYP